MPTLIPITSPNMKAKYAFLFDWNRFDRITFTRPFPTFLSIRPEVKSKMRYARILANVKAQLNLEIIQRKVKTAVESKTANRTVAVNGFSGVTEVSVPICESARSKQTPERFPFSPCPSYA